MITQTFYLFNKASSNVKKVRWLAAELGLSYQHIPAGGQFGRNRETDYLVMNPNGLIPCLQDDDLVLWESTPSFVIWPQNTVSRACIWPIMVSAPMQKSGWTGQYRWPYRLAAYLLAWCALRLNSVMLP